jgi:hypothetical protein
LYLLWGWVVLVCSVGQFILLRYIHYERHYLVWMLTWMAIVYQFVYLYRREKRARVATYTQDIIKYVWIVYVALMFLFYFLFVRILGADYYKFISPGFLALYGMPTVLSGVILRFRPLIFGGIACWAISIAATFIGYDYQLLFLGLAVIVAWIIPGYILQARHKNVNT